MLNFYVSRAVCLHRMTAHFECQFWGTCLDAASRRGYNGIDELIEDDLHRMINAGAREIGILSHLTRVLVPRTSLQSKKRGKHQNFFAHRLHHPYTANCALPQRSP